MTEFLYSILLGAIQGITEFLPISSTGHLVIFRDFLGINTENGLAFDAVLQLATVLAVIVYFRNDLLELLRNFKSQTPNLKQIPEHKIQIKHLIWGTIPAVILGLLLQNFMETIFRSTAVIIVTLIVGAMVMFVSERFLKNGELNSRKSFVIGLFQSLALIPGMSRAGMTISGGYFLGLKKDLAIRFSFLLSIPIIGGTGAYKLMEIIGKPELFTQVWLQLLVGSISAFIFGILSIDFLIKFLKTHSFKGFIIYRIALAIILLVLTF